MPRDLKFLSAAQIMTYFLVQRNTGGGYGLDNSGQHNRSHICFIEHSTTKVVPFIEPPCRINCNPVFHELFCCQNICMPIAIYFFSNRAGHFKTFGSLLEKRPCDLLKITRMRIGHKELGALIQDSLCDGALDIFVLTETWITSDAPSCITNSLAPDGFITIHQHRGSSTDKRGGGIAVIHRQDIKSSKIDHDFSGFESLHLKFNTRKTSFIVSSIYRPPGSITSSFIVEFEELIDFISSHNVPFVICGDFNASGSETRIHHLLEDAIESNGLDQHVISPTHSHGHTLDLLITSSSTISSPTQNEVTYSDHHLISSNISAETPQPSTRVIHRRCISSINWEIFEPDLLCVSQELLTCDLDANDYAILLNSKLEILLDKHAPVKKRSVRIGQHPNNQLSNEAIETKKRCRRMERLYRRKRTGAAKQAYNSAKEAAKLAILNSKASSIKEELNSNANPRSMWRSLHRILHSRPTLMLSANFSSLCSILFSSFLINFDMLFVRKSPTFIYQSPTPSLHRPPHPFHPGSSQARPSQHSRLSRR